MKQTKTTEDYITERTAEIQDEIQALLKELVGIQGAYALVKSTEVLLADTKIQNLQRGVRRSGENVSLASMRTPQ